MCVDTIEIFLYVCMNIVEHISDIPTTSLKNTKRDIVTQSKVAVCKTTMTWQGKYALIITVNTVTSTVPKYGKTCTARRQ